MEELIHNTLGLFGFILWPISGIFLIYSLGAWFIQGNLNLFLIALGIFVGLNCAIWALSAFAE